MQLRIAIVGAGALGGHVGAYLSRAGQDVSLIDPWPAHVEAMRARGLRLIGQTPAECFATQVHALHISDLHDAIRIRPFDIAFLALKSYDTRWASELILPHLSPGGFIVALQNGINEDTIAAVAGWGRTVGCIASMISVELVEPGLVRRNVALGGARHTVFRVGEPHGRLTPRIEQIATMLSIVDSAKTTTNLWGERWSKLVVNAMRNPVAAATGRGGNANDRDPVTRWLAIRIAAEAIRVGRAHGYPLEKVYGIEPGELVAASDGDAAALARVEAVLLEATRHRSDEQRPSMGQDIAKGRRTEIDHINGLVVRRGEEAGIATPANRAIIEVVRAVERGERMPQPEAVAGI